MKKTVDSYEAAYYMMFGAEVTQIKQRLISRGQGIKKGFRREWIIYLDKVPAWARLGWNAGIAYGSIVQFKKMRMKLKKMIK